VSTLPYQSHRRTRDCCSAILGRCPYFVPSTSSLKKYSVMTTPMSASHRSFHVMSRSVGTITPCKRETNVSSFDNRGRCASASGGSFSGKSRKKKSRHRGDGIFFWWVPVGGWRGKPVPTLEEGPISLLGYRKQQCVVGLSDSLHRFIY
jgi:hypothetical protein